MLLDHPLGTGKIQAITYCDELNILSLGLSDGRVQSFHIQVELDRDGKDDDDDDEYGLEDHYKTKVILKRTYEQMEGYSSEFGSSNNIEESKKLHQARASQQQFFQ